MYLTRERIECACADINTCAPPPARAARTPSRTALCASSVIRALAVRQGIRGRCAYMGRGRMERISGIEQRWSSESRCATFSPARARTPAAFFLLCPCSLPCLWMEHVMALDLSTLAGHVEDDVECLLRTHQRRSEGHIKGPLRSTNRPAAAAASSPTGVGSTSNHQ